MPNSSPPRAPRNVRLTLATFAIFVAALLLGAAAASAQTLAHPGWVGNNINTDPWWQHAIFYRFDAASQPDFKSIATRLDALRGLGVDALLLPAPDLPAASSASNAKLDEFDELIQQASRRGLRVLLTLPAATPDILSAARFWLSRGVAGFHITGSASSDPRQSGQSAAQAVRRLTTASVGQRIVLADFDLTSAPAATSSASSRRGTAHRSTYAIDPAGAQLQVDSRLGQLTPTAAALRPVLSQSLGQANLMFDSGTPLPPSLERPFATMLLTLHAAAMIDSSAKLVLPINPDPAQDLPSMDDPAVAVHPVAPVPVVPPGTYVPYVPPARQQARPTVPQPAAQLSADPLTEWYHQLAKIHHTTPALRSGALTLLDFDQQNALVWVATAPTSATRTPPVIIACNLSGTTVRLNIGAAIKGLNLRGNYLRTLLRSDKVMGPQDLDAVTLPPYAVYLGELHR